MTRSDGDGERERGKENVLEAGGAGCELAGVLAAAGGQSGGSAGSSVDGALAGTAARSVD